ncbi:hypothetical protein GLAREA_10076 [Glarea lozoyensis ATCC 20868]|uniref:Uncharacterized protein n=1 Tax=Glarea lozoyensis (strain ATCC 20868 / MF5171) TaxID=1116229 RepID=S3D7B7_GLAL2|nr:uncharacterized protein GLAREA_10076 [Glarea lozoyensis ATCC 20868]EPE34382.1 hypothetical protein GLAREA_10076 [Glarea lozoyensis ATCC 20868]
MEDDRARKAAEALAARNILAALLTDEEIKQSTSSGRLAQARRQQVREEKRRELREEEAKESAQGEASGKADGTA